MDRTRDVTNYDQSEDASALVPPAAAGSAAPHLRPHHELPCSPASTPESVPLHDPDLGFEKARIKHKHLCPERHRKDSALCFELRHTDHVAGYGGICHLVESVLVRSKPERSVTWRSPADDGLVASAYGRRSGSRTGCYLFRVPTGGARKKHDG